MKRNEKSTHLPAETTRAMRWLRSDDGAASSSVATVAGPREGMPLPFSLPRVSTARAASPCRLVFQLLKHPMHVQAIRNVAAGQTHRTVPLVPRLCSSTDASLSLSLSLSFSFSFSLVRRAPKQKNQPRITIQSREKRFLSSFLPPLPTDYTWTLVFNFLHAIT